MLRKIVALCTFVFVISVGTQPVSAFTSTENKILSTLNTALIKTTKATASLPYVLTHKSIDHDIVVTSVHTHDSANNYRIITNADFIEQENRYFGGEIYIRSAMEQSSFVPSPTYRLMVEAAGQNFDADWQKITKDGYTPTYSDTANELFNNVVKKLLIDVKKNGSKKFSISKKTLKGETVVSIKERKGEIKTDITISKGTITKIIELRGSSRSYSESIIFKDQLVEYPEGSILDNYIVQASPKYKYYKQMLKFEEDLEGYVYEVMVMEEEKAYLKDIFAVINKDKYKVSGQSIEYKTNLLGTDTYFCGVYDQTTSSFSIKEAAC